MLDQPNSDRPLSAARKLLHAPPCLQALGMLFVQHEGLTAAIEEPTAVLIRSTSQAPYGVPRALQVYRGNHPTKDDSPLICAIGLEQKFHEIVY